MFTEHFTATKQNKTTSQVLMEICPNSHILGYKASLSRYKKSELTHSILLVYHGLKCAINNGDNRELTNP